MKKPPLLLLFLLALGATPLLLRQSAVAAPTRIQAATGVIAGVVRAIDGAPAAGIRVFAEPVELAPGVATISSLSETDSMGRYRLEGLPPGRYRIAAGLLATPTYFPGAKRVEEARVVMVTPGATITDMNFALARPLGVRVAGHVQELPAGTAEFRVRLQAIPGLAIDGPLRENRTFEFENVPPGRYSASVVLVRNSPGLAPRVKVERVDVDDVDIQGLELSAPALVGAVKGQAVEVSVVNIGGRPTSTDGNIARQPVARIAGHVTRLPANIPPGVAQVWLQSPSPSSTLRTAIRPDGSFEFLNVPSGSYGARVFIADVAAPPLDVRVTGRDIGDLDLAAPPFLVGRIEIEGGAHLPIRAAALVAGEASPESTTNVQIRLRPIEDGKPQWSGAFSTYVRADGFFALPATPGNYEIGWTWFPIGYHVRTISYGSTDLLQVPLRIDSSPSSASSDVVRVVLTTARPPSAPAEFKLSGNVTGLPPGTAASGLIARIEQAIVSGGAVEGMLIGESRIHDDGSFEIPQVPSGNWTVRLYTGNVGQGGGGILVEDHDVTDIQLQFPVPTTNPLITNPLITAARQAPIASAALSGRIVRRSADTPLPQVISAISGELRFPTAVVQSDGSFLFENLPAGTQLLNIRGEFGSVAATVVTGDRDLAIQITLPDLYKVTGRFLLDGGTLLPDNLARIQLRVKQSQEYLPTPAGGAVTLWLPQNAYEVSVNGLPGAYAVDSISYGSLDLRTEPLKISGPPTSEIVIRLSTFPQPGQARVAGKVTALPAPQHINNPNIVLTRDSRAGGGRLEAKISPDGAFAFASVPPGTYTVTTSGLSSDVTRTLEVTHSDIADLNIVLAGISNPFPEFPGASYAMFFNAPITLRGVITQEAQPTRGSGNTLFFRMEVPNASGAIESWAVLFSVPGMTRPNPIPDADKLRIGARVTLLGDPARDGSHRAYLTPLTPANTTIGIKVEAN